MNELWKSIETPWQITLELAWESFKKDSLPIAALIADTAGNIVSTGRNELFEQTIKNRKMAHAEMNAMMNLSYDEHPEIRKYTLYTTTEPCPMCMGSIVMTDLRKVKVAMADPWAGATEMCEKLPYVASKNIDISFVGGAVEKLTAVLAAYRELELADGKPNPIGDKLKQRQPQMFALGEELFGGSVLREYAKKDFGFSSAFEAITSSKMW